jgi:hypothetical protein
MLHAPNSPHLTISVVTYDDLAKYDELCTAIIAAVLAIARGVLAGLLPNTRFLHVSSSSGNVFQRKMIRRFTELVRHLLYSPSDNSFHNQWIRYDVNAYDDERLGECRRCK